MKANQVVVQNFSNIGKGPECITDRSLDMYAEFVKSVCSLPFVDTKAFELASVLWVWVFLSCYSVVRYNPEITINSCNAGFTIMRCTEKATGRLHTFIAKFQLSKHADSLLVDNINGFIVNELTKVLPHTRIHMMEYIDSCLTYLHPISQSHTGGFDNTNANKSQSAYLTAFPQNRFTNTKTRQARQSVREEDLKDITYPLRKLLLGTQESLTDDGVVDELVELRNQSYLCPITFCKCIRSPMNLHNIVINRVLDIDMMSNKLFDLFITMREFAGRFGFTHNDTHLANVLFDNVGDFFVLIDFGRMLFSEKMLHRFDPAFMERVNERIVFEGWKAFKGKASCEEGPMINVREYGTFVDRHLGIVFMKKLLNVCERSNFDFCLRSLYLFDIMCVSMNILKTTMLLKKYRNDMENAVYSKFMRCHIAQNGDIIILLKALDVIERYVMSTPVMAKDSMLLGLYWYVYVMNWLHSNDVRVHHNCIQIDHSIGAMVVNTNEVANIGYIYKSMQLQKLPNPMKFCKDVESDASQIGKIINKICANAQVGGSTANPKCRGKSLSKQTSKMPKVCMNKRVEPVSPTMFEKEIKAYGGSIDIDPNDEDYEQLYNAYIKPQGSSVCFLGKP
jgi:hypothetical protein